MRLSEHQIQVIKKAVSRQFGPDSRIDDSKRGGDIDLLVETLKTGAELQEARIRTMGSIQRLIGEQKIDIVTIETGKKPDKLIPKRTERKTAVSPPAAYRRQSRGTLRPKRNCEQ